MSEFDKLLAGYDRFRSRLSQESGLLQQIAQPQAPKTMVIACSDSRVDPAIILDCGPGELFVVRNVASLVPPAETGGKYHGTSAALEFGVTVLEVKNIVILGHAQCGGIRALMRGVERPGTDHGGYITEWMDLAGKARKKVLKEFAGKPEEEQAVACEKASVLVSLENLLTFPWVRERVVEGTLQLHGWYFDLGEGALLRYNPATRQYESLA